MQVYFRLFIARFVLCQVKNDIHKTGSLFIQMHSSVAQSLSTYHKNISYIYIKLYCRSLLDCTRIELNNV